MNQNKCSELEFRFSCENLKDKDLMSKSDPVVILRSKPTHNSVWKLEGTTEVISNNLNPEFKTPICVKFAFEKGYELEFLVYDCDSSKFNVSDPGELIGKTRGPISDFLSPCTRSIGSKGQIHIKTEKRSRCNDSVNFKIQGKHMKKMDLIGQSDCFLNISKEISDEKGSDQWALVYKSEVITSKNPDWKRFNIHALELCNGDYDRRLRFEVFDKDSDDSFEMIGFLETSINNLKSSNNQEYNLHYNKKGGVFSKPKLVTEGRGQLKFLSVDVVKGYDFLDYAKNLNFNLITAIDATGSNGHITDNWSLHRFGNDNPYQQSIRAVCPILHPYISGFVKMFGFGAQWNGKLSHCHEFGGIDIKSCANDSEEFTNQHLDLYQKEICKNCEFSGPTYFIPIIKKASETCDCKDPTKYTVLVIFTDGVMNGFNETCQLISNVSDHPLSIVIVGVGNADFGQMEKLDDHVSGRDIVQFVPFNKYKNNCGELASEILKEIPDQVVSYMKNNGIRPL